MDIGLRGRPVLVTGGSRGIGRACAVAFAREGAKVALTYASDRDAANRVAGEIEDAGGESLAVPLDLCEPASIAAAVEQVLTRWASLGTLVANAVRWPLDAGGPLAESDQRIWEQAMRANLEGTASTVRAAWPALAASGQGRVTPSGRLSVPEDVASAIVYLGSPANGNISGAYLPVAGGTD
jgi:NAD(P)-dependent dehydrogenase (short-subunit alcohol dehydrogenase family)